MVDGLVFALIAAVCIGVMAAMFWAVFFGEDE